MGLGQRLVGRLSHPARPLGLGPHHQVVLRAQVHAPAEVAGPPLVLTIDHVHAQPLRQRYQPGGAVVAVAQQDVARPQAVQQRPPQRRFALALADVRAEGGPGQHGGRQG
jgi:hypothetical protein